MIITHLVLLPALLCLEPPATSALAPSTDLPPAPLPTATTPAPGGRRRRIDAQAAQVAMAAMTAMAAGEPDLAQLRQAATALALAQPERAQSLLARARHAGWLPEVRVRIDRRFGRDESLDYGRAPIDTPPPPVNLGTRDDIRYEWRATWDLSRIVFNPDELAAHAEALRMADARRDVETLVLRLVFERRRLKAEAATSDSPEIALNFRRELRIQEIEAELDALTGGAFTRLSLPTRHDAASP